MIYDMALGNKRTHLILRFLYHILPAYECYILIQTQWKSDIWLQIYEQIITCSKQYKTKVFDHFFCQYLTNNISDIRLIPLWSYHIHATVMAMVRTQSEVTPLQIWEQVQNREQKSMGKYLNKNYILLKSW